MNENTRSYRFFTGLAIIIIMILPSMLYARCGLYFNCCTDACAVTDHLCNLCGKKSCFLDHHRVKCWQHIKCPHCKTYDRHRLLYFYLQEKTNAFTANISLLHFAPEPILEKIFKEHNNINYVTADLYQQAMLKLDIQNMDLPDNTFDAIICYHVLEHVPDDIKAMKELFRILKPGGWALIEVPLSPNPETFEDPTIVKISDRVKYFGQEDHVRLYGWKNFKERLEAAGFQVLVDNYVKTLPAEKVKKYRLCINEDIYLCTKK